MRRSPALLAGLALAAACGPAKPADRSTGGAGSPAWLEGGWRDAGRGAHEIWWRSGDALDGFGYRIEGDGRVGGVEFLRIDRRGLVAAPKGQAVTRFAIERSAGQSVRFANPAHDFPKWIAYERAGDRLTASIGAEPGKATAAWRFDRGAAPRAQTLSGTLCREGDQVAITFPPCFCGGQVYCAELDGALRVAVFDSSCDGCAEAKGICYTPIPSHPKDGCTDIRTDALVIVDAAP